jgi:hypothetical protein
MGALRFVAARRARLIHGWMLISRIAAHLIRVRFGN